MSGSWERAPIDVLIATMITGAETMYHEVSEATMNSMMQIPQGLKVLRLKFPEPVIDVARDKAARVAMMNGARWLFFTDSDIIMPPDTLQRLIAHDKPIVGGLYARRHHPPFNEMLRLTPEGQLAPLQAGQFTPGELVSCDAVATGCMLVRTDVFDRIKPFKMTIDGVECPPAWFLWTVDRLPPPTYSEDFSFCVRAKQSGIDVFCDTSIVCKHVGPMRISPDLGAGAQMEFMGT
jgi:hypothetical protein